MRRAFVKIFILFFMLIILLNFVFASIVINEFAVDSKNDRNGDLNVNSDDEYFELYNSGLVNVNITGWNLSLIDNTIETYTINGSISAGGYLSVLNPTGIQNNDGQILLLYPNGSIVDFVSYGNYNDGNISDNALSGSSNNNFDECLARIPNGKDTNSDFSDFVKTACTFNKTNNFILINNKINVSCAFENNNVTISADVNASNISSVIFSYTINGSNKNSSGTSSLGSLIGYEYTINSSELVGGKNITWNVYVSDIFGNIFSNGIKTFYVRNKTDLNINPVNPDGDNGWYINEPLFSLVFDANAIRKYYRWDSTANIIYSIPFGLAGIPNGAISGGLLELNYYSEFNCNGNIVNETNQKQMIKVDLVNPRFENLNPENNSIIYSSRPEIGLLLDEVYNGNSGINKDSVYMRIDGGSNVSLLILDYGNLDAVVSHTPSVNLSNGVHSVMVYAEDSSGRSSNITWEFEVNVSSGLNLIVRMPENASYNTKRVPFNISTNRLVDSIEFINYNDRNPRWKRLCNDCDGYGNNRLKLNILNEGENEMSFRAVDNNEEVVVNVSLFIDGKKPKISKILPSKNSVTNGSGFYVKFIEDNVEKVSVSFNPTQNLNLSACSFGNNFIECFINLNLNSFDGQQINYIFNVSDPINSVVSKEIEVLVDTTSPILVVNDPQNISYNGKIPFNISVSENIILEYYDEFSDGRWKRLCSNCNKYGFDKIIKKNFESGEHNLSIRAVDKAGNGDVKIINFNVSS